jgi:hypothetical protein
MRYVLLAMFTLGLASPMFMGCDSDSEHTKTVSHNPITGTTTEKDTTTTHTDTHDNNNP